MMEFYDDFQMAVMMTAIAGVVFKYCQQHLSFCRHQLAYNYISTRGRGGVFQGFAPEFNDKSCQQSSCNSAAIFLLIGKIDRKICHSRNRNNNSNNRRNNRNRSRTGRRVTVCLTINREMCGRGMCRGENCGGDS